MVKLTQLIVFNVLRQNFKTLTTAGFYHGRKQKAVNKHNFFFKAFAHKFIQLIHVFILAFKAKCITTRFNFFMHLFKMTEFFFGKTQ